MEQFTENLVKTLRDFPLDKKDDNEKLQLLKTFQSQVIMTEMMSGKQGTTEEERCCFLKKLLYISSTINNLPEKFTIINIEDVINTIDSWENRETARALLASILIDAEITLENGDISINKNIAEDLEKKDMDSLQEAVNSCIQAKKYQSFKEDILKFEAAPEKQGEKEENSEIVEEVPPLQLIRERIANHLALQNLEGPRQVIEQPNPVPPVVNNPIPQPPRNNFQPRQVVQIVHDNSQQEEQFNLANYIHQYNKLFILGSAVLFGAIGATTSALIIKSAIDATSHSIARGITVVTSIGIASAALGAFAAFLIDKYLLADKGNEIRI